MVLSLFEPLKVYSSSNIVKLTEYLSFTRTFKETTMIINFFHILFVTHEFFYLLKKMLMGLDKSRSLICTAT